MPDTNFNPRSSYEERLGRLHGYRSIGNFNPRSSYEERRFNSCSSTARCLFQSTLLIRGATRRSAPLLPLKNFNPRSSYEERQFLLPAAIAPAEFQSTLLIRGATDNSLSRCSVVHISIHAPHTRSDTTEYGDFYIQDMISIHAPHTRSDFSITALKMSSTRFQSTLLIRGATLLYKVLIRKIQISIHAPHTRSDVAAAVAAHRPTEFQSTLLIRGAT